MRSLLLFLLLCLSCQLSPLLTTLPDAGYFPLQTGQYRIYAVTEQHYRIGQSATTRQYDRRETTGAPFLTLAGDSAYILTYAHRTESIAPWQIDSMGTARQTPTEALLTSGGQTVVKLAFPAFDNQRWNGNRFNILGPDEFRLQRCHQPFNIDNKAFERTLTVVQQNDSTLVSQDKRVEVYGYQIGLVYAERQQLRFCANDPGCTQPAAILYGIRQFIRLTDYGKE